MDENTTTNTSSENIRSADAISIPTDDFLKTIKRDINVRD